MSITATRLTKGLSWAFRTTDAPVEVCTLDLTSGAVTSAYLTEREIATISTVSQQLFATVPAGSEREDSARAILSRVIAVSAVDDSTLTLTAPVDAGVATFTITPSAYPATIAVRVPWNALDALSWAAGDILGGGSAGGGGGGLVDWAEAVNTSAPNDTVPAVSLAVVSDATDADAVIAPKGTGALLGQVPDGTVTGGEKRGAYATDFQRVRWNSNEVASGYASAIGGGSRNIAGGYISTVAGGERNYASGEQSFIGGGSEHLSSAYKTFVGGGQENEASGVFGSVLGGIRNKNYSDKSNIGGGDSNQIAAPADRGTIAGGYGNNLSGSRATIGGGAVNVASGAGATIAGGGWDEVNFPTPVQGHTASGDFSTIGGGTTNTASGPRSTVGGGYLNGASGDYSTIGGGRGNTASGIGAVIVGGGIDPDIETSTGNTASGDFSFVGGGTSNSATGYGAVVVGGGVDNWYGTGNSAEQLGFVGGGVSNTAGEYSVVVGGAGNSASLYGSVVVGGQENTVSSYNSFVGGGYSNTVSGIDAVVAGGKGNEVSGYGSSIGGGEYNTVESDDSGIFGGVYNTISGFSHYGKFIGGGDNNTIENTCGYSIVVGGYGNTIYNGSQRSVIAGGGGNAITGQWAVISGGVENVVNAKQGAIPGGFRGTTRGVIGRYTFASNGYVLGREQQGVHVTQARAGSAGTYELSVGGILTAASEVNTLPNNSTYFVECHVVARSTDGDSAAWKITGCVARGANAASTALVGSPTVTLIGATAGASAWSAALTANTTYGAAVVTGTNGGADAQIEWVSTMYTTEISFEGGF